MKPFTIKKICAEWDRPPYSHKLDEYFETFVFEHILKPFNIIIDSGWKVVLSIMIFKKESDSPEGVNFYEADVYKDDKLTVYPVALNLEDIYKSEDHIENIVSLYFQIISMFFISYSEALEKKFLVSLMDKLDWEYLLALPYPAQLQEQGYVDNE